MRSSCIVWSAWHRNLCFLRTYYAKWLIWLDQRYHHPGYNCDSFTPCLEQWNPKAMKRNCIVLFKIHAFSHALNCISWSFSFVQNETYFTLRDLKKCKLSGNIFNILFNLNKFMAFETRDPFLIRQVITVLHWSVWIHCVYLVKRWWFLIAGAWKSNSNWVGSVRP